MCFRPGCLGHQVEGQRTQKVNRRDHYGNNRVPRANIKEDHKQWGRETNSAEGNGLVNRKGAKMSKQRPRNTFNQRGEAGSKRGRGKGRMVRQHCPSCVKEMLASLELDLYWGVSPW